MARTQHVRIRVVENNFAEVERRLKDRLEDTMEAAVTTGERKAKSILKPGHGVDTGDLESRVEHTVEREGPDEFVGYVFVRRGTDSSGRASDVKDIVNEFGSATMRPNVFLRPAIRSASRSFATRARRIGRGL